MYRVRLQCEKADLLIWFKILPFKLEKYMLLTVYVRKLYRCLLICDHFNQLNQPVKADVLLPQDGKKIANPESNDPCESRDRKRLLIPKVTMVVTFGTSWYMCYCSKMIPLFCLETVIIVASL